MRLVTRVANASSLEVFTCKSSPQCRAFTSTQPLGLWSIFSIQHYMVLILVTSLGPGYIHTAINDGPGCLTLRCADPSCGSAIGEDMVLSLVSLDDQKKYMRYLLRSYVEDNRKVLCSYLDHLYKAWIDQAWSSV